MGKGSCGHAFLKCHLNIVGGISLLQDPWESFVLTSLSSSQVSLASFSQSAWPRPLLCQVESHGTCIPCSTGGDLLSRVCKWDNPQTSKGKYIVCQGMARSKSILMTYLNFCSVLCLWNLASSPCIENTHIPSSHFSGARWPHAASGRGKGGELVERHSGLDPQEEEHRKALWPFDEAQKGSRGSPSCPSSLILFNCVYFPLWVSENVYPYLPRGNLEKTFGKKKRHQRSSSKPILLPSMAAMIKKQNPSPSFALADAVTRKRFQQQPQGLLLEP